MSDKAIAIAVVGLRDEMPKGSVQKRLKWAMAKVRRVDGPGFLLTDDNDRIRAAVAAVILESNEADELRLKEEWTALQELGDALNGKMPAQGISLMPDNPVGILKIWGEVCGAD